MRRISVMFVTYPKRIRIAKSEVIAAVKTAVERVARDERRYRLTAARAWLDEFHRERLFTWGHVHLAWCFDLRGIILGNQDQIIILEHAVCMFDLDKNLKTWFKPDGTLSHISGSLY